MGDYTKVLKDHLRKADCFFERQGKGDHEIWYSHPSSFRTNVRNLHLGKRREVVPISKRSIVAPSPRDDRGAPRDDSGERRFSIFNRPFAGAHSRTQRITQMISLL